MKTYHFPEGCDFEEYEKVRRWIEDRGYGVSAFLGTGTPGYCVLSRSEMQKKRRSGRKQQTKLNSRTRRLLAHAQRSTETLFEKAKSLGLTPVSREKLVRDVMFATRKTKKAKEYGVTGPNPRVVIIDLFCGYPRMEYVRAILRSLVLSRLLYLKKIISLFSSFLSSV